jgi:hypothetical protein
MRTLLVCGRWKVCVLAVFSTAILTCCSAPPASPPPAAQKTFDSPWEAGDALFAAIQKDDQAAMLGVLGPDAKELISSGDPAEDKDSRDNFLKKYQQMHRIGLDADNRKALVIGSENWPLPIPLVSADGKWRFDTDAAKSEILFRRVGRNENAAIRICRELVAAEKEFFAATHDGDPIHQYAQHIVSTPGHHDGLFWQSATGEAESPIGPLLAFAGSEITAKAEAAGPVPFNGYYFRMLRAQGASAPGGVKAYVVNDHMTGGFGFLAYPAEYRSSGVMTFMAGKSGIVYQQDLGKDTTGLARGMTEFDPDSTWEPTK